MDMCHPQSSTKIYTRDTIPCNISIPAWGSIWGSAGFSRNQNKHGSSCAHVTCIFCGLSVKTDKHAYARVKRCAAHEDHERICLRLFCVCGRQKPEDPQIELYGWRSHHTGWYRKSGISGVCLWSSRPPLTPSLLDWWINLQDPKFANVTRIQNLWKIT